MTLSVDTKFGILAHGDAGDEHWAPLMAQWRAMLLFMEPTVLSMTETAPPGTPDDGDAYIIPSGASGAWFGHTNKIARWSAVEGLWELFTPKRNWVFGVDDEGADGVMKRFNGTAWVDLV